MHDDILYNGPVMPPDELSFSSGGITNALYSLNYLSGGNTCALYSQITLEFISFKLHASQNHHI